MTFFPLSLSSSFHSLSSSVTVSLWPSLRDAPRPPGRCVLHHQRCGWKPMHGPGAQGKPVAGCMGHGSVGDAGRVRAVARARAGFSGAWGHRSWRLRGMSRLQRRVSHKGTGGSMPWLRVGPQGAPAVGRDGAGDIKAHRSGRYQAAVIGV